jgi:hypothetical protein
MKKRDGSLIIKSKQRNVQLLMKKNLYQKKNSEHSQKSRNTEADNDNEEC